MANPGEILTEKCTSCGAPTAEKGLCEVCGGAHKDRGFKACAPPSAATDCDCPVVGYSKIHAPWCDYY